VVVLLIVGLVIGLLVYFLVVKPGNKDNPIIVTIPRHKRITIPRYTRLSDQ